MTCKNEGAESVHIVSHRQTLHSRTAGMFPPEFLLWWEIRTDGIWTLSRPGGKAELCRHYWGNDRNLALSFSCVFDFISPGAHTLLPVCSELGLCGPWRGLGKSASMHRKSGASGIRGGIWSLGSATSIWIFCFINRWGNVFIATRSTLFFHWNHKSFSLVNF